MSESNYVKFNEYLKEFLTELSHIFPEELILAMFASQFDVVVKMAPSKPASAFREAIQGKEQDIKDRKDSFFSVKIVNGGETYDSIKEASEKTGHSTEDIQNFLGNGTWKYVPTEPRMEIFQGIDFAKMWSSRDVSANTREAIWEYLDLLVQYSADAPLDADVEPNMDAAFEAMFEGMPIPDEVKTQIRSVAETYAQRIESGELDMQDMMGELLGRVSQGSLGIGPGLLEEGPRNPNQNRPDKKRPSKKSGRR
jgi:hypothetical protein